MRFVANEQGGLIYIIRPIRIHFAISGVRATRQLSPGATRRVQHEPELAIRAILSEIVKTILPAVRNEAETSRGNPKLSNFIEPICFLRIIRYDTVRATCSAMNMQGPSRQHYANSPRSSSAWTKNRADGELLGALPHARQDLFLVSEIYLQHDDSLEEILYLL